MEKVRPGKVCLIADKNGLYRRCMVGEYYHADEVDAYIVNINGLVEKAKSLLSLTVSLLGDGMTRETEPIEVRELREAIEAVKLIVAGRSPAVG